MAEDMKFSMWLVKNSKSGHLGYLECRDINLYEMFVWYDERRCDYGEEGRRRRWIDVSMINVKTEMLRKTWTGESFTVWYGTRVIPERNSWADGKEERRLTHWFLGKNPAGSCTFEVGANTERRGPRWLSESSKPVDMRKEQAGQSL